MDLATISRDDLLLDALGRGDQAPDGDDLAAMFAAWRTGLDTEGADAEGDTDLIPATVEANPQPEPVPSLARTPRPSPIGWRLLRAAAVALAVVGLGAGLAVGSRHSGPSSPLWSLTKVLYPQQAEVRSVEQTIDRARASAKARRFDEARRLVDSARAGLARIDDTATVTRLRADLDAILRELPVLSPTPTLAPSTPTKASTGGGPSATRTPVTQPTSRAAGPPPVRASSPPPGTVPLPPLPSLLPDPIPSLLPKLPLPTGPLVK
ncbi:hypothetical protein JNW88_02485 [Micromonospora sp. ATA32]|nr:hypothetical protein [Micromonospora sp. ATA32]